MLSYGAFYGVPNCWLIGYIGRFSPVLKHGTKKLKNTSVSDDACLSCHENDHTAEATADVTALTDLNGTMVNPHDIPQTEQHEKNITCSSCHTMHSDDSIEDEAVTLCQSCHHRDVYECDTCHTI